MLLDTAEKVIDANCGRAIGGLVNYGHIIANSVGDVDFVGYRVDGGRPRLGSNGNPGGHGLGISCGCYQAQQCQVWHQRVAPPTLDPRFFRPMARCHNSPLEPARPGILTSSSYCTVRATLPLWLNMPEVAVTVIWYVPDGVPPVVPGWCECPPQPDTNTSNSARRAKAGAATFLRCDHWPTKKIDVIIPRRETRPAFPRNSERPRHSPGDGVIPAVLTGAEV